MMMTKTPNHRLPTSTAHESGRAVLRFAAKTLLLTALVALVTTFAPVSTAAAADVHVVVHPALDVEEMSGKDLRRIFFKQKSRWPNGVRAKPIDRKISSDVRKQFSEDVLDRTIKQVDSFWTSQVFAGKDSPPPSVKTDAEVIAFVKSTPGAVGYVSAGTDVSSVKVLKISN